MEGNVFDRVRIFQDLTPEQTALVGPLFTSCYETAGDILFEQGEIAEFLFLVIEGEVTIRYKPDDGPAILVAHIHADGVVGWSAVLGNPTYTSSAVCASDCLLLRLRNSDLRQLCERHHETAVLLLEKLATAVSERLHSPRIQVVTMLEQGLGVNGNSVKT